MENNDDKKTLIDYYDNAPEDVKGALFSAESANIIQKIGQEYKLNVRQIGVLADEAGLLMLGASKPKEFVKNLNKRLGTDKDTVQKVVNEVNTRIFAKIRESLRKIHGASSENKPEGQKQETEKDKEKEPTPISRVIKPRTAPFVVSPEKSNVVSPEKSKTEETPASLPAKIKPANLPIETEKPSGKDLIEERKKEEGFRSKPSFTEYKKGTDPYREPVD